jgi:flagellar biosynthesis/type III secretory pathway chaperone
MTTTAALQEVVLAEADLAENLTAVLEAQQQAVVHSRVEDLTALIQRSEELLHPIHELERERLRLTRLILGGDENDGKAGEAIAHPQALLKKCAGGDAQALGRALERLREASKKTLKMNRINKPLLDHARQFIRHTLRVATDDFSRNLIDRKM